jgi:hypothetical protein
MSAASFSEVFRTCRGYLADKWEQSLAVCDRELVPFLAVGRALRLLEIGIAKSGFLLIWKPRFRDLGP